MNDLEDGSIDCIIADLPYGTTQCKWDEIIPFDALWRHYKRLIKPRGAILLTASQPFSSKLVASNPGWFRYSWIWAKNQGVNFLSVRKQPLKVHEEVLVFGKNSPTYYPQMTVGTPYERKGYGTSGDVTRNAPKIGVSNTGTRYPKSIIQIKREYGLHPTQKPVALMEYLIKTYTLEGDTILDNTMGCGTTGVAALNTGRDFVGIEKDPIYFALAEERIKRALEAPVSLQV